MERPGTKTVYRLSVALIWALAVWNVWLARGLFIDGSHALLTMLFWDGYALFYKSRETLMAVTQTPAAVAILLGVTDTHLLGRLLSVGLFFVPTAYYHLCLHKARRDPALLGAVLLAIAVVYMPTNFFAMGEYNTIMPAILFVALVVATERRPTTSDGVLLAGTAVLLLRSYDTMLAFGLLAAAMLAWRLNRSGGRGPRVDFHLGYELYLGAVLLFIAAASQSALSLLSLLGEQPQGQLLETLIGMSLSGTNVQFVLPLAAVVIVTLAGLAIPRLLEARAVYLIAGILLVLLALCPLMWMTADGTGRPLARSHYHTRIVSGFVVAVIIIAIWLYAARPGWAPRALAVLSQATGGRYLMLFGLAAFLASLPADIQLSELWRRSVVEFQKTIASRPSLIDVRDTPFAREPYNQMVETWTLASQSVVLRRSFQDGLIVPSRDFTGWQFFDGYGHTATRADRYLWGHKP